MHLRALGVEHVHRLGSAILGEQISQVVARTKATLECLEVFWGQLSCAPLCSSLDAPNLQSLTIGTRLVDDELKLLCKAMERMYKLKELSICVADSGLSVLESFFQASFRPIQALLISPDATSALLVALKQNTRLGYLKNYDICWADSIGSSYASLVEAGWLHEYDGSFIYAGFVKALERNKARHKRCVKLCIVLIALRNKKRAFASTPKEIIVAIAMYLYDTRNSNAWDC